MTKPTLYLRIAAVLTLIHCILHTVGGVFGAPPEHSVQGTIAATMKSTTFPTMGVVRSYSDFLLGYGLILTIILFTEAVVFWQLATIANHQAATVRPLLVTFCVSLLGSAIVAGRYFFLAPAITEIIIAICLGLAFFASGESQKQHI